MPFTFLGKKNHDGRICQGFPKKYKLSGAKSGDFFEKPEGLDLDEAE